MSHTQYMNSHPCLLSQTHTHTPTHRHTNTHTPTHRHTHYLLHHGLLILFLLGDFDWWQLGYSRDQEVEQDVLTVGHLVHHVEEAGGKVVGVQVVVVPEQRKGEEKERETGRGGGRGMVRKRGREMEEGRSGRRERETDEDGGEREDGRVGWGG